MRGTRHVCVRRPGVLESEHAIHDRAHPMRSDGAVHVHEHLARPDEDPLHPQSVHQHRHQIDLAGARKHTNQADRSAAPNGFQRPAKRPRAADLDDVVHTDAARQFTNALVPLGRCPVVHRPERAEPSCPLELLVARRRDDHASPRHHGKLQREDRHATRPEHEHRVARLDPTLRHQRVPRRQRGARKRCRLFVRQVLGNRDDAVLGQRHVLGKHTVDRAAER